MKHSLNIQTAGVSLDKATKALIMLHGRGGTAEDILSLAPHFNVKDYALLAPQATNNTWYPLSFMAPIVENEPFLSSAIETVDATVQKTIDAGITPEHIYFFGFSQGACLSLEYCTRHAQKFGGVGAVIGGLIGQELDQTRYKGDFAKTPVFIGTSDPDFHVPLERVRASADILRALHAEVTEKVYNNAGHTISQDEVLQINKLIFR